MTDIFPIKALNKLVSKYYCLHLTPIDYVTAANQKRNDSECTLAYYAGNDSDDRDKRLIIKTVKSVDGDEVIKCSREADGRLTLFGSCEDMFHHDFLFDDDISAWDVSGVTDMVGMFDWAKSFNQDISAWDVSNVAKMGWMFCEAESFNQDISEWDVSGVTGTRCMFHRASSFNQDLSGWNISDKTDMNDMFDRSGVVQIPKWHRL